MIKGSESKKFEDVLQDVYCHCRFMAYFYMQCEIIPSTKLETMGVTTSRGRTHLLYNEKFVEGLSKNELVGVLAHEFMHVVNDHVKKENLAFGPLANVAMDMVINEHLSDFKDKFLLNKKIELPNGAIYLPRELKEKKGELTWKEVYDHLKKKKEDNTIVSKRDEELGQFTVSSGKVTLSSGSHVTDFNTNALDGKWKVAITIGTTKKGMEVPLELKIVHEDFLTKKIKDVKPEAFKVENGSYGVFCSKATANLSVPKKGFKFFPDGVTFKAEDENYTAVAFLDDGKIVRVGITSNDGGNGGGGGDGDGEGEEGKGKGKKKEDNCGGFDDHTVWEDVDNSEVERVLERAKEQAKGTGAGDTSGDFFEMLEKCRKIKVKFKEKLFGIVDIFACEERDYSWRRLNRRLLAEDIIEKGLNRTKREKLTVAVDVSGSMSNEDLQDAFGAIEHLSKKYALEVLEIDAEIKLKHNYKTGDWKKLKMMGRGGTVFAPLFEHMKGHKETLIVITDGGLFDADQCKPYGRTIWLCTMRDFKKPFGKFVYFQPSKG